MSRADMSGDGPYRPVAEPPAMSSTAPMTGSSATAPGKAVVPLSAKGEARTMASPIQPSHPRRASQRCGRVGSSASSPPSPSSHILVVVTK
jgi:hypothetical protein